MKKQALINAIESFCERRNQSEITIDELINYLAESGTGLKWEMLHCVASLFARNQQHGPRKVSVDNGESIFVISENTEEDISYLLKQASELIESTYPDQNVIFERDKDGFRIIIESLRGL